MGALDPHAHKRNQQSLSGSHGDVTRPASDSGQHIPSSMDELPMDLWPSFATSEDYYSTVVPNLTYSSSSAAPACFYILLFVSCRTF